MKPWTALVVVVLVASLLGCGGDDGTATSADRSSEDRTVSEVARAEEEPFYPIPSAPPKEDPLEKLVAKDVEAGTGPVASWGDKVTIRYVGLYYETGEIYSQHWTYSDTFELEKGESYGSGWDKGIQGMRVGGRRELLIPSDLLFGDGDVAYVVALLKVKSKGLPANSYEQEGAFAAITVRGGKKDPEIDSPDRPAPKKLLFRELEEGIGPAARRGDEVAIRYAGAMYETGEVRYGGKTRLFQLGFDGLGEAFERGLEGMRAGGRRELIVPSRFLGGSGAVDYVIELKRLEPAPAQQLGD